MMHVKITVLLTRICNNCLPATVMQCTWLMFVLHDMGFVHGILCLLLDNLHGCCCCINHLPA